MMTRFLALALVISSLVFAITGCGGGGGGASATPAPSSQAPSITTQPSNNTSAVGNDAQFTVNASGTSLSYQWQENSGAGFANLTDSAVYSGATTAVLMVKNITAGMNGFTYRVIVSGSVAPAATSSIATLTTTSQSKAVVTVSVANLPQAGIQLGIISFTVKIPAAGVTPTGLSGNNASAAVTFLSQNLSAGLSGVTYDAANHQVVFGGLNSAGTVNGRLMEISFDIAPGTVVSKSDFSIISPTISDINTSYPNATLPIDVTFK